MNDFWLSCGHHLTDRDAQGRLLVTDDFLKVYFARPELRPPADADAAEKALHADLLADPRRRVEAADIAALGDADARENWELMIGFRDRLLRHRTLEEAYLALVCDGVGHTPPLFIDHLVHVILRNALDESADPFVLRAAELFFRPQRMMLQDGMLLAIDEETIAGPTGRPLSPLVSLLGLGVSTEVEVLSEGNAHTYWGRSDRFDLALDLTAGGRGALALAEAMTQWVRHLLALDVAIEPLTAVRDARWTWYVGLDAQATRIGDRLWRGEEIDEAERTSLIGLFRLLCRDETRMIETIRGEPVYLLLTMTADSRLRMKPQNLLTGLPLRQLEAAS